MTPDLFLVVMAGGSGTRFWPKSTSGRPKQLLSFGDGSASLLIQTLSRFDGFVSGDSAHRLIVTTRSLRAAVENQAPGVAVLAEPQGRNTSPCVYWAAREVARVNPKGVMLVMPSDHYIPNVEKFVVTVRAAAEFAATHDDLITLGIRPTRPETGYGYLKSGAPAVAGEGGPRRVEAFIEKPDVENAQRYVSAGTYFWNAGMFVWRAETILRAFDEFMPEMKRAWDESDGDVEKAYPKMTATSIDYGVMEKARNVVTFPLDCGWDDLGSWTSLESLADAFRARRECGVVTAGDVIAIASKGNIVDAPARLVALLGVQDLIVAAAGDSILVAHKDRAQDIKLVVEQLKKKRPELA